MLDIWIIALRILAIIPGLRRRRNRRARLLVGRRRVVGRRIGRRDDVDRRRRIIGSVLVIAAWAIPSSFTDRGACQCRHYKSARNHNCPTHLDALLKLSNDNEELNHDTISSISMPSTFLNVDDADNLKGRTINKMIFSYMYLCFSNFSCMFQRRYTRHRLTPTRRRQSIARRRRPSGTEIERFWLFLLCSYA